MNNEKSIVSDSQEASTGGDAADARVNAKKATSAWDWIWPTILGFAIVKLFGAIGGVVAFGSYFLLSPKLGNWGALAVAAVLGVAASLGVVAMIQ